MTYVLPLSFEKLELSLKSIVIGALDSHNINSLTELDFIFHDFSLR